jgi:hypothetical protein
MKFFKIILFVFLLIIIYISYLYFREPKLKEGFSQTPLNQIAQAIRGGPDFENGLDIKSILQRYQSTSNTPQANKQIQSLLSDITNVSSTIGSIQNQCQDGECENIPQNQMKELIPVIQNIVTELENWMTANSNIISMPDQQQLQANLDIIIGYEYLINELSTSVQSPVAVPSVSHSQTYSPLPTATSIPTATFTPTPTPSATTAAATFTPTPTPSATTAAATFTPTPTPSATTAAATFTPTPSATTAAATFTPTPSATTMAATFTPTPSATTAAATTPAATTLLNK